MPTFYEKLTWSPGDGAGLQVSDTKRLGRIGGLICGENGNSLARYALMAQGEQLHVSRQFFISFYGLAFIKRDIDSMATAFPYTKA